MLLLRGATLAAGAATSVSIHAPLARSNGRSAARRSSVFRFQHAPLARSNRRSARSCADLSQFQYMLLLRGATGEFRSPLPRLSCFNTCSSCEEQQENLPTYADLVGFNTCSSCEVQRQPSLRIVSLFVSIHAPLARCNRGKSPRKKGHYV